jgi:hypothetical protein
MIGTPVGQEALCFDAHRVFDPETVLAAFRGTELAEFSLLEDGSRKITEHAEFQDARRCRFACGLFVFHKPESNSDLAG